MKRPLVIFGAGEIAQLAHYYFHHDSNYRVVAFTVDDEYVSNDLFEGLPLLPFSELGQAFPVDACEVFVALSYAKINILRQQKYLAVKSRGYKLASYVSSRASVLNKIIGDNCFILEDNTIQPYVCIGNNVTLWSGNHIGHHSIIGDHCFISSHVVISGGVQVGERCFIGVNSTLRDHIKVGENCVIGAGSLLLSDAEPGGVYMSDTTIRSQVPSSRLRGI